MRSTPARPAFGREIVVGLVLFGAYLLVEHFGGGRLGAANVHGWRILRLEEALRLDIERSLNHALAGRPVLRTLADYEYATTYVISALVLLIWLWFRRPATYRWARTSFILLNVFAFAIFLVWPATPPRLLPGAGFIDTVTGGRTVGSWGNPLIDHANQLAAMPSLHIAWAVWVSVVLACVSGARWVQGVSLVHVLLTTYVIMATANHYLLDAVGGALLAGLAVAVMAYFTDRPGSGAGARVAASDAFFLHVDSPEWPQQIGGLVMMTDEGTGPYPERLRALMRDRIGELPRLRTRLTGGGRWRRYRWQPVNGDLDWDWHVPHFDLTAPDGSPGGRDALRALVAELQATRLPRDRPLWRFAAVTGFAEPSAVAAVMIVHHVVSDGLGTVAQVFRLLEPSPVPPRIPAVRAPVVKRAAAVVAGLAQLATDGGSKHRLRVADDPDRRFGLITVPLDELRAAARTRGIRVTDVLVAAATAATATVLGEAAPARLRVSEPLIMGNPDGSADGNVTGAILTRVAPGGVARPMRRDTRALASRWVMSSLAGTLPPPVHAWFARTVYGYRFFHLIVSNMPGPDGRLRMAGGVMGEVYPILPLAPRAPVAVGALSWDGLVCLGICVTPGLGERFIAELAGELARIRDSAPVSTGAESG